MAIQSFDDKSTESFFYSGRTKKNVGWANIRSIAKRKLDMLHYATQLKDLRSPPGNHLEALKGDLVGYHSICINDQWRIIFKWIETGPIDVKICDYH